ncbi:hypothetical protein ACFPIF_09995 [Brevundimonas faecalis]|uniref:hypothetical protein n=1 Tax=Brevundimonas faecalis TaxID=947378 RepID=UPI0036062F09
MSGPRTKAAKTAAVTAPEPGATAAAPASTASADQVETAPATSPVQDQAAPAGSDPAPTGDQATYAPPPVGEPLVIGMDFSSAPDETAFVVDGGDGNGLFFDGAFVVHAVSNRAPYTRGGIHFASRRSAVVLPTTTTPDQVRRLIADTAITLSLVHQASGQAVELPRDLFDADGDPDFDRLVVLADELARQVIEATGLAQ